MTESYGASELDANWHDFITNYKLHLEADIVFAFVPVKKLYFGYLVQKIDNIGNK